MLAATSVALNDRAATSERARFHLLMGAIVSILLLTLIVLFRGERISIKNPQIVSFWIQPLLLLAIIAAYCHWRRLTSLREGCFLIMWASVLFAILMFPSYAAAKLRLPFEDQLLAAIDQVLGVNAGAIVAWIRLHSSMNRLLMISYGLVSPLTFAAVLVPAVTNRLSAVRQFLLSVTIAAILAVLIFAFLPAIGPWAAYHFQPYDNQLWTAQELQRMRAPGPTIADPFNSGGLITFPSFHVVLAILATRGLWSFHWLRPIVATICLLIAVSTVTTGWHYASDTIAGAATAFLSAALSKRIVLNLARYETN